MARQSDYRSPTLLMCLLAALALTVYGCGDDDPASPDGGGGDEESGPVSIDPGYIDLAAGASWSFSATVSGHADTTVTWSIAEGHRGGLIDGDGVYIAPGWAGRFHVVATSNADPAQADSAEVLVSAAWECDENTTAVEDPYDYAGYFEISLYPEPAYGSENPINLVWSTNHLWIAGNGGGYLGRATDTMTFLGWFGLGFDPGEEWGTHDDGGETFTGWHAPSYRDIPWGGYGPGQFRKANDVDVDGSGNIYVTTRTRIQRLDAGGTFINEWTSAGPDEPEFVKVDNIAASEDGFVYAADSFHARIHKFRADGTWIRSWGESGRGDGQFSGYLYLDVDAQGTLYVCEDAGSRVQKFDGDGNWLGSFGQGSGGPCDLSYPRGIAVDPRGFVFVMNASTSVIKKFTSDGGYLTEWAIQDSGYPVEAGNFFGIATDDAGNVYAVDHANDTVVKFTR